MAVTNRLTVFFQPKPLRADVREHVLVEGLHVAHDVPGVRPDVQVILPHQKSRKEGVAINNHGAPPRKAFDDRDAQLSDQGEVEQGRGLSGEGGGGKLGK